MLKNENIICISSIDWDFVWQRHQEIMSSFVRNGNRVLFIENTGVRKPTFKDIARLKKRIGNWLKSVKGFRKESDGLFIYSPVVLPFPYSKVAGWINRRLLIEPLKRWVKATGFRDPIIWTFLPTSIALDIINEFDDRKLLVYDCTADFDELTDNSKKLRKAEEMLIRKCDVIFAQGEMLADKCRKLNKHVYISPPAVNAKVYEDYLNAPARDTANEIKDIKKPIIGYVGGIHKHVDLSLIYRMACNHPEWSIVLVGPRQTDTSRIDGMANVFVLGKKEFDALPGYIHAFDVCTIPYVISEYTKTVYPTKLNEYHIMGKPVVSTALPEVEAYNRSHGDLVALAKSHEDFICFVEKTLLGDSGSDASKRMKAARLNSWAERIKAMNEAMERAIKERQSLPSPNWQERFLRLYKHTSRTTVKLVGALVLIWLLVFYTPLMWFFAEPLKISQPPERANAIVVFAGGVGESGKAGQGYEERVGYATELYKKGYADRMVLSSGYTYYFEETLLMKALAVALGVPEKAIILQDTPRNTYENVMAARSLFQKEGWNRMLLVTSPYNTRRSSLVFARKGDGIRVVYTPVPDSSFYQHVPGRFFDKRINLKQIRGIIHEYLGMLYYWWKGWI